MSADLVKIAPCDPFEVTIPAGGISNNGIKEIERILRQQVPEDIKNNMRGVNMSYWKEVPEAVGDEWMVKKGRYAGTFPKRLAKHVKKIYKQKLDPQLLGVIGEIASRNTQEQTKYVMDFTDKFDWRDGEFYDEDSCFWGSNAGAKPMIRDAGGLAVRFYDPENKSHGIGRAWMLPWKKKWCVFNGYGYQLQTITISRILATITGTAYKRIYMSNRGSHDGMLWINGGKAYIIGEWSEIEDIEAVDFTIEVQHGDGDYVYCESCDARIHPEDAYHVNWEYLCENCYHDYYFYCENCNTDVDRNSECTVYFMNFRGRADTTTICSDCLAHAYECDKCGDWWMNNRHHTGPIAIGDMEVCPTCADTLEECSICGIASEYITHRHETPKNEAGHFYLGTLVIPVCEQCNVDFDLAEYVKQTYG
jgi:hypothetical protein